MTIVTSIQQNMLRKQVGEAEWQVRLDLAAAYRLIARNGWDDGIFTHNSAPIPGHNDQFLLNAYGLMFHEITASNLVKVDLAGDIVDGVLDGGADPGRDGMALAI